MKTLIFMFYNLYFSVNVVLLWWEYFTLKNRLDNTIEAQTLSADACNEHTFLILSILFTLFSVNRIVFFKTPLFLNHFLNYRLLYLCWFWLCVSDWIFCPLCFTSQPIVYLNSQPYIGNLCVHFLCFLVCMHFGLL